MERHVAPSLLRLLFNWSRQEIAFERLVSEDAIAHRRPLRGGHCWSREILTPGPWPVKQVDTQPLTALVEVPLPSSRTLEQRRAHVIKHVYEIDPLPCPQCRGDADQRVH
jgi:hypothetical protein